MDPMATNAEPTAVIASEAAAREHQIVPNIQASTSTATATTENQPKTPVKKVIVVKRPNNTAVVTPVDQPRKPATKIIVVKKPNNTTAPNDTAVEASKESAVAQAKQSTTPNVSNKPVPATGGIANPIVVKKASTGLETSTTAKISPVAGQASIAAASKPNTEQTTPKRRPQGTWKRMMTAGATGMVNRLLGSDADNEHHHDDNDDDAFDYSDDDDGSDADSDASGNEDANNGDSSSNHGRSDEHSDRNHEKEARSIEKAVGAAANSRPITQTVPKKQPAAAETKPIATRVEVKRITSDTSVIEKQETLDANNQIRNQGRKKSQIDIATWIVQGINLLFPVFFLVLAALHIVVQGRPATDSFANAVAQANTIAVTLWPIMFAAIATQSIKAYATFKAERGIKLMTLEQLLHSSSFSSALKQPLLLRRIDIVSVGLFIFWCVSPLGSQALQRLSGTTAGTTGIQGTIAYTLPGGQMGGTSGAQHALQAVWFAAFQSGLNTPPSILKSPQDAYGNPKIPSIARLTNIQDGWAMVSNSSNTAYSSVLGRPLGNVSMTSNTQAIIQSTYFEVNCSAFQHSTPDILNQTNSAFLGYYPTSTNEFFIAGSNNSVPSAGQLSFAIPADIMSAGVLPPVYTNQTQFSVTNCSYENVVVLADVQCYAQGNGASPLCQVNRVQRVQNPVPSLTTPQDLFWDTGSAPIKGADIANLLIASHPPTGYWDFLLAWLLPDRANYNVAYGGITLPDLATVNYDSTTFSRQVETMLNGFYQSGGNDNFGDGVSSSTWTDMINLNPLSANAIFVDPNPVWTIVPSWLSIFFICDAIILLFAISDIFIHAKTISPDFLGFASSTVRSNSALRKEFRGRKLSGHEKTRAMAEMKVMLQDMDTQGAKGKIALAPASSGGSRLRRDRDYM